MLTLQISANKPFRWLSVCGKKIYICCTISQFALPYDAFMWHEDIYLSHIPLASPLMTGVSSFFEFLNSERKKLFL